MNKNRISLLGLGALIIVSMSLVAGTASAEPGAKGKKGKKHRVVKEWVQGHMQLGDHYMLSGKYQDALRHFEIVAKLDGKALRAKLGAPEGDVPEEALRKGKRGKRGHKGKNGRRGHGGKALHMKFRAHMSAAVAAHKMGKPELSEQWAEKALELAQAKDFDRGVKMAERFLDEPDEIVFRRAPSVQELEKRLKVIDSELGAGK
jgi:hypothetical protein